MGRLGGFIFLAILVIFICVSIIGLIVRIFEYICTTISDFWHELTTRSRKTPEATVSKEPQSGGSCQYGRCEICGKEFSGDASSPDDCLRRTTYNFYGKERTRLICGKCLAVLRKEQHLPNAK